MIALTAITYTGGCNPARAEHQTNFDPSAWLADCDGEVVGTAHAGAEALDVGAVDVQRDRYVGAVIADPVDVTRRREAAHLTGPVDVPADLGQRGPAVAQREQLFVLGTLHHAGHAPGDVVVDRRLLPGPPHQRADRERPVRLGVQGMADISVRAALSLAGGQDVRAGQVQPQLIGDQLGRPLPVGVLPGGTAYRGYQVGGTAGPHCACLDQPCLPRTRRTLKRWVKPRDLPTAGSNAKALAYP